MEPSFRYPWPKYKSFTILISRKSEPWSIVEKKFADLYKSELKNIWIITDPLAKSHRIRFEANLDKPLVTDGWFDLKNYYTLEGSCIFKLRYLGSSTFDFTISICDGKDVNYRPQVMQIPKTVPPSYPLDCYGNPGNVQSLHQCWVSFHHRDPIIGEGSSSKAIGEVSDNTGNSFPVVLGRLPSQNPIHNGLMDHVIDMDISNGTPNSCTVQGRDFNVSNYFIHEVVQPDIHVDELQDHSYVAFFETTTTKYNLSRWELRIPLRASHYLRQNRRTFWYLRGPSGTKVEVKVNYPSGKKYCTFGSGWKKFYVLNKIILGSKLSFGFRNVEEGLVEVGVE